MMDERDADHDPDDAFGEGWNDVAHDRGADFHRAWAAWLVSDILAALEGA